MKPLKKHIRAVQKTIKMWEWLRDNPYKDKKDYFKHYKLSTYYTRHECYLCYYWQAQAENLDEIFVCTECPLRNNLGGCHEAYYDFVLPQMFNLINKSGPKSAQIIVDLCKEWLKNVEEL